MDKKIEDLKVLFDNQKLTTRIKEVADEINAKYQEKPLTMICVLNGAVMFYSELVKHLKIPIKMHFIRLSSYGNSQESTGKVSVKNLDLPELKNENVIIVEDIIDTGLTLDYLIKHINTNCEAKSVELAVLLDKKCKRKFEVKIDYCAFEIDDKFIVGFGLDYNQFFRNLDFIGYFE